MPYVIAYIAIGYAIVALMVGLLPDFFGRRNERQASPFRYPVAVGAWFAWPFVVLFILACVCLWPVREMWIRNART